jgi:hypothetical protein
MKNRYIYVYVLNAAKINSQNNNYNLYPRTIDSFWLKVIEE